MSELVRGLAIFLGPGQYFVNGQPISKIDFLLQNVGHLFRGVAMLGLPFGLAAWIVLSLCISRKRLWRDAAIIFVSVMAWNAVMTPIDYRLPEVVLWVGPYAVFGLAVVLCVQFGRRAPAVVGQSEFRAAAQETLQSRTSVAINADISCINCGYSLRTLSPDAKCPECGFPVRESLREISVVPKSRSIWGFIPVSFGFFFGVGLANLVIVDLHLRFRNSYPLKEGLWGNKWLFFALISTMVVTGAMAVVGWPVFWLALRRKRLLPSLGFLFVAVVIALIFSSSIEQVPFAPIAAFVVAICICAWSSLFERQSKRAET